MKTKEIVRQEISDLETEKRVIELRIQIKEEELENIYEEERVMREVMRKPPGLVR